MRQVIQEFYDLVLADAMRVPSPPETPKRPPTTPGQSTDQPRLIQNDPTNRQPPRNAKDATATVP